tara:strand:- start:1998 stop:2183 length:186 start_codon:yes stop_codon:yes gene_type:complete
MINRNKVLEEEKDLIKSKQFHEDNKEIYKSYFYYNIFLVLGIITLSGISRGYVKKFNASKF